MRALVKKSNFVFCIPLLIKRISNICHRCNAHKPIYQFDQLHPLQPYKLVMIGCVYSYIYMCVCVVMLAAFLILFVLRSLKSVSWPIAIGLPPSSCLVWGPLNNFNFFLKTTKPIINYFWFQASLGRGECKLRNVMA